MSQGKTALSLLSLVLFKARSFSVIGEKKKKRLRETAAKPRRLSVMHQIQSVRVAGVVTLDSQKQGEGETKKKRTDENTNTLK